MLSRYVRALVVHEAATSVQETVTALRKEFIVRTTSDPFDMLEHLAGTTLACVVVVAGKTIRCEDIMKLVARASPDQAKRVIFMASSDAEALFCEQHGLPHVSRGATGEEVLAIARALAAGG